MKQIPNENRSQENQDTNNSHRTYGIVISLVFFGTGLQLLAFFSQMLISHMSWEFLITWIQVITNILLMGPTALALVSSLAIQEHKGKLSNVFLIMTTIGTAWCMVLAINYASLGSTLVSVCLAIWIVIYIAMGIIYCENK